MVETPKCEELEDSGSTQRLQDIQRGEGSLPAPLQTTTLTNPREPAIDCASFSTCKAEPGQDAVSKEGTEGTLFHNNYIIMNVTFL